MEFRWDSETERDSVSRSKVDARELSRISMSSGLAKLLRVTDPRSGKAAEARNICNWKIQNGFKLRRSGSTRDRSLRRNWGFCGRAVLSRCRAGGAGGKQGGQSGSDQPQADGLETRGVLALQVNCLAIASSADCFSRVTSINR
jgi:hypothetical protein